MAAPVDSARIGTGISTAATSGGISVGSPVAGTLLIVFVRFTEAVTNITFTGYTLLAGPDSSDATNDVTVVYYRLADGSEGASDTISWTTSAKFGALSWEVTGADDPAVSVPQISTVNVGTTAANSANGSSVAPDGAPQDTLYLAMSGGDGEGGYTAAPTNYTNLVTASSGTGGVVATNVRCGGASRQITASSSDDPGAFTHIAHAAGWAAYTVAIRPPAPVVIVPNFNTARVRT